MILKRLFICLLLMCCNLLHAVEINVVFTHENQKDFALLLKSFEKQSDIKINPIWMDQSELKTRLIKIVQMKSVPDVLIQPSDHIGMVEYAFLSEIPDKLLTINTGPHILETITLNNKIYAIPIIRGNHLLMYYNKNLVKQPATSWKEMLAQKQQLATGKELIVWSFMEMYWFAPFINSYGELPLKNKLPNLDTKAVRESLKFVWQLARDNVVDSQCNYSCAEDRFKNEKVAYTINGIWAYQKFKQILGDKLGLAKLPQIQGRKMMPFSSSIVASFPNNALAGPKKEALDAFATFLQSPEFQYNLWLVLREIPANTDVFNKIKNQPDKDTRILFETLEETTPLSSHKNMAIVWEALLKGYTRYGSGAWNEQRASRYMQNLAEKTIQKNTGK